MPKKAQDRWDNYPELGRKTAAAIPGARLQIIDGAGHIPHIQDFESFRRVAEEFLGL